MENAAKMWLRLARAQMKNRQALKRILFFTYEEFTDRTAGVHDRLLAFLPELRSLDIGGKFLAKSILGRGERPIQNFNALKIKELSVADREKIQSALKDHADILSFFGYSVDCGDSHHSSFR